MQLSTNPADCVFCPCTLAVVYAMWILLCAVATTKDDPNYYAYQYQQPNDYNYYVSDICCVHVIRDIWC